jgi:hypothetical protein
VLAKARAPDGTSTIVLACRDHGRGRVVTVNARGTWRWALVPALGRRAGQVHHDLWRFVVAWSVSDDRDRPTPRQRAERPAAAPTLDGPPPEESAGADPELMRRLARVSGGEDLSPAELDRIPVPLSEAGRLRLPQTLWDTWWLLCLVTGVFATELVLRERRGLP